MGKPQAKKKVQAQRETSVKASKVQKKKPLVDQLKHKIINETGTSRPRKSSLTELLKKNGGKNTTTNELPKPGRFVLAPPRSPSEPSGNSDSEEEEYIDRFFDDVEVNNESDAMSESSSDESEPSEEDDDDDEEQEEDEEASEEEDVIHEISSALENGHSLQEVEDDDTETESDSESSSSYDDYHFSPSDLFDLNPDLLMDDDSDQYEFNYEDGDEIEMDSYSDSPSSCGSSCSSKSDPDEYVQSTARFLDLRGAKIELPEAGSAIVELDESDDDDCPQLVPIPESFSNKPAKIKDNIKAPSQAPNKTRGPQKETARIIVSNQEAPEPFDLEGYMSVDSSEMLVHLKKPFYFHGLLSIRVIAGCIELLHHTRRSLASSEEMIAMATIDDYPVQVTIKPEPTVSLTKGFGDPAIKNFHHSHLMEIKHTYEETHAVLLLRAIDCNHLKFMQSHITKKIVPDELRKAAESVLRCKFYQSHPKHFTPIAPEFLTVEPSSEFPRIITVGGKNVGKSTFNKCIVNSLLSSHDKQVLYVDLDIGQPEFGVPQTISAYLLDSPVIGKGFLKCHRMEPYFSLVYGHCNVALDAVRYSKCVKAFFNHLNRQTDITPIPWVVNTMGYVRGVGLDLMHCILSHLKPTHVLQFKHPHHHLENFSVKMDPEFMQTHESSIIDSPRVYDLRFEWQSVAGFAGNRAEDMRQLKGIEARQMNILCHLGLALNEDFSTILNEVEPIRAPLDRLQIVYVGEEQGGVVADLINAINGNMVYLCNKPDNPPFEDYLEYLGVGIVRAVDEEANQVNIVSGIRWKNLMRVNCLALTSIPLPIPVITSQSTVTDSSSAVVGYLCQAGSQTALFRNIIDRPFRTEAASKH